MKVAGPDRWWRRREWLLPLGFAALLYPLLLLGSSDLGASVGLSLDVNARQALARALSYAADPHLPVVRGNDGELVTPALDGNLVALQFGSLQASAAGPGASPPALAPTAPPPAVPPPAAAAPPPAPRPTIAPVAVPPPVRPPPSPTPTPSPSPTPNCKQVPRGSGVFAGQVVDPEGKDLKGGATVQLFWNGCLLATAATGGKGDFVIPGLAAGTRYSYIVTAPQFNPGAAFFTTDASGNHTEDPRVQ